MYIIPKPQQIAKQSGFFNLENATYFIPTEFKKLRAFAAIKSKELNLSFSKDASIVFQIVDDMAKEEYSLAVTIDKIIISATFENGAFYGLQSLIQLIKFEEHNQIQCVDIKDKPRFEYRSFMLDIARHFFSKDKIKQYLDIMASLKMNTFHWHLSDDQGWRIEIKKYPLLTQKGTTRDSTALSLKGYIQHKEPRDMQEYGKGCFFTQEEIKEVVAYADSLFINVVPEIDMPGHLVSAIACYPNLSCKEEQLGVGNRWGVMDDIGCCGKEDVYTFAKDVIDELCELFPYPYFHIGGDEVPKGKWKECPKCQAKIKELNLKTENDLQGYFNNEMAKHLHSKNRSMIGWNEILEASDLSNDTIIQWWTGMSHSKNALEWIEKGNKAILSKSDYVYMDHLFSMRPLKKTYEFDLNKLNIDKKFEKNILGIECPQWTEYIRTEEKLDMNTFPRLHAMSEVGWTNSEYKNYENFEERLQKHLKSLQANGINCALPEVYNLVGFKGFMRRARQVKDWICNPNCEVKLNNEAKKHLK